ncbi:GTP cyclohydrolase I FolE [Pyrinomonas methylaliphatogenes]|jgi:GTP cyclohydrolase I|uniref:GTP cyclohydrolase 1 n=1 Tax=Pyrinomonas methylaliphatogenes TaxID=454194 RepID=A0A0B6WYB9_9BACT|nr:GTP cyclohydrolase I FolE [Pyrinomonas methylaliphatogenes]CDM65304.1 GTP cyclohydrolase I [Pyrinomonas methylaliphatogenes]
MNTQFSATEPDEEIAEAPPARRQVDLGKIAQGVRLILEGIGEDPDRPGLRRTPQRVAEMYAELTAGMDEDPHEYIVPLPGDTHDEMVIVKDIQIASLCEHHLAPFVGRCHIAYIPKDGRIIGLSKLARLADAFARRLQVQERLTSQIADTLYEALKPVGVMVVIEAEHTCMTVRGVKKPGSLTITSAIRGGFRKDQRTRAEAMALIKGRG